MMGLPDAEEKQRIFTYSFKLFDIWRLSLDALAVLDAIDRRGSFAAAAVELDRVPSAITYTVRRLEDDLDVLLFDRRGHRAQFTPAGRALLDAGRELLAAAGEASSSASGAWPPDGSRELRDRRRRDRSRSRACCRWSRRSTRIARPSAPRTRSCGSGAKCWAAHGTRWPKDAPTSCSAPPAIRPRAAATGTACWPRSRACSPSRRRTRWPPRAEPLSEAAIARHRGVVAADSSRRLRAADERPPVRPAHAHGARPRREARRAGRRARMRLPALPARRRRDCVRPPRRARRGNAAAAGARASRVAQREAGQGARVVDRGGDARRLALPRRRAHDAAGTRRARQAPRDLASRHQRIVAPASHAWRVAARFRRAWNPTSTSSHPLTV